MSSETGTMAEDAVEARRERLSAAIDRDDVASIRAVLAEGDVEGTALLVDRLSEGRRSALFELLPPEEAADVLGHVHSFQGAGVLEELEPATAARIVGALDSDDRADLLNELDASDAGAILERLDAPLAEETRQFMAFPEGTAGSMMYSESLSFRDTRTVAEILDDLREHRERYAEYGVQYAYVLNAEDRLRGVLPVRNLLFAERSSTAAEVMIPDPVTVHAETPLGELDRIFERHDFLGLPVVDGEDRLIGVVDREAAADAREEEATEDMLKIQGLMGREELRSMALVTRSRRRLSWLSVNIGLNVLAASVIAFYQDTLQAVIALAVFLPIISDMSGNSGIQAVAVSMRELSLQLVRPREFLRVLWKEIQVGLINGATLGALLGGVAWLWKDNAVLGLVVGAALAVNTTVAVCVGGTIPLALKGVGQDPALASGPILTTITDMVGFLLALSMAAALLPFLAG